MIAPMIRTITVMRSAAKVFGCAAVPPTNALVRDAAAAIQIGQKVCNAKGV
jgi:hypothetical protein